MKSARAVARPRPEYGRASHVDSIGRRQGTGRRDHFADFLSAHELKMLWPACLACLCSTAAAATTAAATAAAGCGVCDRAVRSCALLVAGSRYYSQFDS